MFQRSFRKLNQAVLADRGRGGARSLKTGVGGVHLVSQGHQSLEKHSIPGPTLTLCLPSIQGPLPHQKCLVPPLSPSLTTSVFAAPAGHPEMGRLGELGAQGALGAPLAAEADVGSSIQRYPDAPSWR